jgi:hypothetical protein
MKNPPSIQHIAMYRTLCLVDLELLKNAAVELDATLKSKKKAAFLGWIVDASGSTTDYFQNRYTTYKYSFWDKKCKEVLLL